MPDQPRTGAAARSDHTRDGGVPWWGAVLIAVTATLIGIGIEAGSGNQELGVAFAGCYALGCVAAAVTVRRSGIFTAVIQPPLVLFVAVPLAYYLFHESAFGGLKDALITCGYPLIERFPLMLFTSAVTLLVGLLRWYRATSSPQAAAPARTGGAGMMAGLSARMASAFTGSGPADRDHGTRPSRPRHVAGRPASRARGPQERAVPRGRHARPVPEDFADAPRRGRRPVRDSDRAPDPRRQTRDPRRIPPPPRRDPRERWEAYDPARRPSRESYGSGRGHRRDSRYGGYDSYGDSYGDSYEPWRQPARSDREPSHHPISRVRYRDPRPPDADVDASRNRPRR